MRIIAFAAAAFVIGGPAVAQSWEDYSYPEYAISVAFPASPQIETTTYQIADRHSVPARVYSVRQDNSELVRLLLPASGLAPGPAADSAPAFASSPCRSTRRGARGW
jgi:hypothetical protein